MLNIPVEVRDGLLRTDDAFAVVSGPSRLSVTGDVAVERWRFFVDSAASGSSAPIVVLKSVTNRTMHELAANPSFYNSASALNEDAGGISIRLTALMAEVLSNAEPSQPNSHLYTTLAQMIRDPHWTGVMVFNATATVPSEVLGRPTGALADRQVAVLNMGFEASKVSAAPDGLPQFFGMVDQAQTNGDTLPPGIQHLRARFANGALAAFEQG